MKYYAFIKNDKKIGLGQCPMLNEDVINAEITKEIFDDCLEHPLKYIVGEVEKEIDGQVVTVKTLVLNPNWEQEELAKAKEAKYNEANNGAKTFLESGNALFEFEEGKHIEATSENIGKFTGFAIGYITGKFQPTDTVDWNTKEDENVFLNVEQVGDILEGLGKVQSYVWTVQFPKYVQAIKNAETIEEVQAINIQYCSEESVEGEDVLQN